MALPATRRRSSPTPTPVLSPRSRYCPATPPTPRVRWIWLESRKRTPQLPPSQVIGDCAYGDGQTRQAFSDAGYDLAARVPGRPRSSYFVKGDFDIDLKDLTGTCPAGQTTSDLRSGGYRRSASGDNIPNRQFVFARSVGGACELRRSCLRAKSKWGRRVRLHPQEGLLQRARMLPRSAQYPEIARRRRVIEHRLARLVQLGVRRTRFFGRTKTAYQLLMAATVANLTLTAGKVGALGPGGPDTGPSSGKCPRSGGDNSLNRATSAATAALLADIDAIAANNASELLSAPIRRIRTLLVQLADTGRLAWGFRPSL